jgi:hypothetical protein
MNRTTLSFSLGLLALAAPTLSASNAFAATTCTTEDGTVVTISDPGSCKVEVSDSCTANCTADSFKTTCTTQCDVQPETTCTNSCETDCHTECTKEPDTFSCEDDCSTRCEAGCSANCSDDSCSTECHANCDTQCQQHCEVHPGATDCNTICQDCCTATCTVEATTKCDVTCSSKLEAGCTAKCDAPDGGLFCDGQFINVSKIEDCNFEITVTAHADVSTSCALNQGGSTRDGFAVAAITGLGLLAAGLRRRRPVPGPRCWCTFCATRRGP